MKKQLLSFSLISFFLLTACSKSEGLTLLTVDETKQLLEKDEAVYLYIVTDEEYFNQLDKIAKEQSIDIKAYNIYKPDAKTEQTADNPFLGEIPKDQLSYIENGEVVASLNIKELDSGNVESALTKFVNTVQ